MPSVEWTVHIPGSQATLLVVTEVVCVVKVENLPKSKNNKKKSVSKLKIIHNHQSHQSSKHQETEAQTSVLRWLYLSLPLHVKGNS